MANGSDSGGLKKAKAGGLGQTEAGSAGLSGVRQWLQVELREWVARWRCLEIGRVGTCGVVETEFRW